MIWCAGEALVDVMYRNCSYQIFGPSPVVLSVLFIYLYLFSIDKAFNKSTSQQESRRSCILQCLNFGHWFDWLLIFEIFEIWAFALSGSASFPSWSMGACQCFTVPWPRWRWILSPKRRCPTFSPRLHHRRASKISKARWRRPICDSKRYKRYTHAYTHDISCYIMW